MTVPILLLLVSLVLLILGAEGLVRGSAALALKAGITPLVVGLTIVAFGTSSPELVVSIRAAMTGQGDIAVGNVVGSNIFNIAVILGLTALVCPVTVRPQLLRFDVPLMIGASLLLLVFVSDSTISRFEGGLLFASILAYTVYRFWSSKAEAGDAEEEVTDSGYHWSIDLGMILVGLAVLVYGSQLLVDNAVIIARTLGVSEAVIGLTIIAAGTSMPELATSVVAALRRQPDIAIGNVVGSNLFNILSILGISSLVHPLTAAGVTTFDYLSMLAIAILLFPLLYTGQKLTRPEGGLLVSTYLVYLFFLWPNN